MLRCSHNQPDFFLNCKGGSVSIRRNVMKNTGQLTLYLRVSGWSGISMGQPTLLPGLYPDIHLFFRSILSIFSHGPIVAQAGSIYKTGLVEGIRNVNINILVALICPKILRLLKYLLIHFIPVHRWVIVLC